MTELNSPGLSIDTQQWHDALNHANVGEAYLLAAYQPGEMEIDDDRELSSWCDFNILQINRKIRAEAWDYLIKSNTWILVTLPMVEAPRALRIPDFMPHDHQLIYETRQSQPFFPYYKAPEECSQRLTSGAALSLWLSNTCDTSQEIIRGTERAHRTVMFAYKPFRYNIFVQQLLNFTSVYTWNKLKGLIVKTGSIVQPGSAEFRKLIEPLRALRGLNGVEFHGIVDCPALCDISQQIRHRFNLFEELLTIQKFYWQQGRDSELRGCYPEALCHYQVGVGDMYQRDWTWTWHMLRRLRGELAEGSPEYNSMFHIRLDTINTQP